jgi:ubiquinone/menaquinone biosynthesis C-methylase UbiE
MPYDPTIYAGSAPYYARGRPPYSRVLGPTLASKIALDGTGRLLDVGSGPGVLGLQLHDFFDEVVALDPDREMLAEGASGAATEGVSNLRWVQAGAEDISEVDLGTFRLVTFGQSFQ